MNKFRLAIITVCALILSAVSLQPAHAINYTVTYNANETMWQQGLTSGSIPNSQTAASGTLITVASNSGSLARQGFTFAGWNTSADGTGTNYTAGSGTFTLNADTTLYAKWTIPQAASLIASGGSIIPFTNTSLITNGSFCTDSNVRGITSDGTAIFFRPSLHLGYICKMTMGGNAVEVSPSIPTLAAIAGDSLALTYSSGCIFVRPAATGTASTVWCIDPTDWSMTSISLPTYTLYAGSTWLYGNLIDFPDGRIGAVSAPGISLPAGNGAGQCPNTPVTFYCKVLRLFNLSGQGKNVVASFSEDIVLADTVNSWPSDEHGIATDGTYLYEIRHQAGYKVWGLRSGAPSYLVFNGDGSGTCGATTGTSGTLCTITYPVTGLIAGGAMSNATYIGHNHLTNKYIIGDYDNKQFYLSPGFAPPAGPGTLNTISSFSSFSLAGSVTTALYRTPIVITANVSTASKVTFKLNGRVIVGCKNRSTTGNSPNIVATCSWKPTQHGEIMLSATAIPTNPLISNSSISLKVIVGLRTGSRG